MSGYIGITLWTFIPLILAYFLYKLHMPDDIIITFMLMGLLFAIYWIIITTAIIIYGVQKYIELGSLDLFIQEFLESVRKSEQHLR